MTFRHQIAKYELYYFGKRQNDTYAIARITFYNSSNRTIGYSFFYRDASTIPTNSSVESTTNRAFLNMHESQLDTVVDMLRNEKPCYIYYSSPTWVYISTGKEPIGEEES